VQGNIIAPKVSIEEGAHFRGSIEMDPAAVEKALGKTTANGTDTRAPAKKPTTETRPNLTPPAATA
jgi:hypothetical protein